MGLDPNDPRAPYVQIADELRQAIERGRYKPGDKLPPVRQLARDLGVAGGTVQSALDILRSEGRITSWQGRGIYVRDLAVGDLEVREGTVGESAQRTAELSAIEDLRRQVEEQQQVLIGIRREVQDHARLLARMRRRLEDAGITLADADQRDAEAL